MTREEIDALTEDEVLALMRREGLEVVHSFFSTVHFHSENRPDGWTEDELDEVGEGLTSGDLARWKRELARHFATQGG